MREKVWRPHPGIWIRKYQDYKGDDYFQWTVEVHDWCNAPVRREGESDSREALCRDIGSVVAEFLLVDGGTYGL